MFIDRTKITEENSKPTKSIPSKATIVSKNKNLGIILL